MTELLIRCLALLSLITSIKNLNTKWILAITFIVVTWVNFNIVRWQKNDVIIHDVISYYSYLPATFYEKDLSLSFLNNPINQKKQEKKYWPNIDDNGNKIIKVTMGMALTYLPFFAGAHLYCILTHQETSGFSEPYHFAIQFSSLIYFLIGLVFLIRILKLYYYKQVIFITVLSTIFGTNVLHYLTTTSGMAHPVNFALIAMFIYHIIKWHQTPTFQLALYIGLTGGLITLIRPINGIVFLILLGYSVQSFKKLVEKLKFLMNNYLQILLIIFCTVLVCIPQLIYWKWISGNYLINSYVGERFYFGNPHIIDGLFSFRKGWLIYTPIMLFSLIGFYDLLKRNKHFFIIIFSFTLIYLYLVFSWWCWWYGGSYGQRALIDIYPLLSLPLAAFLSKIQKWSLAKKRTVYGLFILLILFNCFQTIQARWNIIHYDSMTKEAYIDALFRIKENPDREKFLKHPDYKKAIKGIDEY